MDRTEYFSLHANHTAMWPEPLKYQDVVFHLLKPASPAPLWPSWIKQAEHTDVGVRSRAIMNDLKLER